MGLEDAEKSRQKLEEEWKALQVRRALDEQRLKTARENTAKAERNQLAATEKIKQLSEQADAAKKRAASEIAAAEGEVHAKQEAIKTAREASAKQLAEAARMQVAEAQAAKEAAEKAH